MNIMIAVNEKYVPHVKVMLASLRDSMREETIDVYLVYHSLSQDMVDHFIAFGKKKLEMTIYALKIDKTPFDDCEVGAHFSIETLYRLMACDCLPEKIDRILWLDADIVIRKSLKELYDMDIDLYAVAAGKNRGVGHSRRLGLPDEYGYFNAGVLLMNLEYMRGHDTVALYKGIVYDYGEKLKYNDQDILNIAYHDGKVLYFDSSVYNYQIGSNFAPSDEEYGEFQNNCAVMHFAATSKPWNTVYRRHLERSYWHYALQQGRIREYLKFLLLAPISTLKVRIMWKLNLVK